MQRTIFVNEWHCEIGQHACIHHFDVYVIFFYVVNRARVPEKLSYVTWISLLRTRAAAVQMSLHFDYSLLQVE